MKVNKNSDAPRDDELDPFVKRAGEDDLSFLTRLAAFGVRVVGGMAIAAALIYTIKTSAFDFSDEAAARWGQFGDYMGGVLNPIIGLFTLFLVLLSIRIQRKEMS